MKLILAIAFATGLAIPQHHLKIASRVAGGGMPHCESIGQDGVAGNCLPAFFVRRGSVVNGWSLNGEIAFSSGAIRKLNDDEFALLSGHEIAHYYLRHRGSSRAAELEADRLGAHLACKAGFDPASGATLFQHLRPSKLHPSTKDRIATVMSVIC